MESVVVKQSTLVVALYLHGRMFPEPQVKGNLNYVHSILHFNKYLLNFNQHVSNRIKHYKEISKTKILDPEGGKKHNNSYWVR